MKAKQKLAEMAAAAEATKQKTEDQQEQDIEKTEVQEESKAEEP